MTHRLFVGWDVAGWKCPVAKGTKGPRDALVLLQHGDPVSFVAQSKWTNFKNAVLRGTDFIADFVHRSLGKEASFVVAIDAPLGWPDTFMDLLGGRWIPPRNTAGHRPILRRTTDIASRGQSAVGQRLGSASTKAIAYLSGSGYARAAVGVFTGPGGREAIETYPAAVRRCTKLDALHAQLVGKLSPQNKDFEDALYCALVGAAYAGVIPGVNVVAPGNGASAMEGWIWSP